MLRWLALCCVALLLCTCQNKDAPPTLTPIPIPQMITSGTTFLTPESQTLQADEFSNPGMLWVDKGAAIFAKECAACHSGDARIDSAAARYPALDAHSGTLTNLEGRINYCRIRHMDKPPLPYESEDLLALTAYTANRAQGQILQRSISPALQSDYAAGERYFHKRRGQFNLSCAQCHNAHWGKKLRGDTISQGHGNGFPAYRFEWETLGSLHRRLADCDRGVRAEPFPLGSKIYTQVELYLAVRANGLIIESPAVRR